MVAKKFFSDKQIEMWQCPEIEKRLINRNVQAQKIFDTWYYIAICGRLCVSFSSKAKATNVCPKRRDQSIQARKIFVFTW